MTAKPARTIPPWFGPIMVFFGAICIGFAPIGLRWGLGDLGPQAIAFWRYVFALPVLFLILLVVEKRLPMKPNRFVVIAGTCFALEIGLWHWGLTFTTVANATFIVSLGNVCAGLTAWLFLKQRPAPVWGFAVLIALIGAATLAFGGGENGKADIRGDFLSLCGAIILSGYVVASNVARRSMSGLQTIFWLTVTEIFIAALLVTGFGEAWLPSDLSGFAAPLFLALVVQIGGQGLIILGLGHTSPAIAGIVLLTQPVVAAAVSWQLFDEPLAPLQGGGAALILVGILLAQRGNRQTASKPS